MSVLFILIGASILLAAGFLFAFIWSMKTGQFDDAYTPSVRMLFENVPKPEKILKQSHDEKNSICKTDKTTNKNIF